MEAQRQQQNQILSTRHKHSLSTLNHTLKESIRFGGNAVKSELSFYCISEMDLSQWANNIWMISFSLSTKIIGLSNPSMIITIFELYNKYILEIEKNNIDLARCILCSAIALLSNSNKNPLVDQCSTIHIVSTTGRLLEEDWKVKMDCDKIKILAEARKSLHLSLKQLKMNCLPAEGRAVICLIRGIIESDEDRMGRCCGLLHLWKCENLVWSALLKLCEYDANFTWGTTWILNYAQIWTLMQKISLSVVRDNNRPKTTIGRNLLFQGIMLLNPRRKFGFYGGYESTTPTDSNILSMKRAVDTVYSPYAKKKSIPKYDKNLKKKSSREIYCNYINLTNYVEYSSNFHLENHYQDHLETELSQQEKIYGTTSKNKFIEILQLSGQLAGGKNENSPLIEKTSRLSISSPTLPPSPTTSNVSSPSINKRKRNENQLPIYLWNRFHIWALVQHKTVTHKFNLVFKIYIKQKQEREGENKQNSNFILYLGPFSSNENSDGSYCCCEEYQKKTDIINKIRDRLSLQYIKFNQTQKDPEQKYVNENTSTTKGDHFLISAVDFGTIHDSIIPNTHTLNQNMSLHAKENLLKEIWFYRLFINNNIGESYAMTKYLIYNQLSETWIPLVCTRLDIDNGIHGRPHSSSHRILQYNSNIKMEEDSPEWESCVANIEKLHGSPMFLKSWYNILCKFDNFDERYFLLFSKRPVSELYSIISSFSG